LVFPAFAGKGKKKKKSSHTVLTEKQEIELKSHFFEANREKMLGNYENAEDHFEKCIQIDPNHSASYYEIASLKVRANLIVPSIPYLEKAVELQPKNKWYRQSLAGVYENAKMYKKGVLVYEDLIDDFPNEVFYYENLANMYLYQNDLKSALKVYDRIEDQFGITEFASTQKQKIHMSQGDFDKAISEAKKLIESAPNTPRYYTKLAELYSKNGQQKEAIATYQNLLKIDPENAYVQLSMATYYYSGGEKDKGADMFKKAFANPNLDFNTKARLLFNEIAYKDVASGRVNPLAFDLAENMIEAHPEEAKSYAVLADLSYQNGNKSVALENYKKSLEKDKNQFLVWSQVLLLQSEEEKWDSVYATASNALEYFPSQPTLFYFSGIASIQLKKYQEAIDVLESGKDFVLDNNNLLGQFYTYLADAYHNLEKHENSDAYFEKALKLNPNDDLVLNNYSYYLSIRGEKLERAAEMSRQVVDRNPTSSTYLDTYAWVLYKKGDYSQAREWMEKALSNGGDQEGILVEHYGDILFKLGDTEGALKYWRRAKELGGTSEFLDKKISTKELYE
jgi:tetratricopeptide (TPR) repeat protein